MHTMISHQIASHVPRIYPPLKKVSWYTVFVHVYILIVSIHNHTNVLHAQTVPAKVPLSVVGVVLKELLSYVMQ